MPGTLFKLVREHLVILLKFLRACALLPLLVSCNHLFYQPMKETITTPARAGLKYHPFTLTTKDGETLAAWKIPAIGEKIASVVHFHGNGQNMTSHFAFVAWLAYYGYDVVVFDYRGYGSSTGTPNREGLVEDGRTVLTYLDKLNMPFFIVAQSLGGAVAIPSIVKGRARHLRAIAIESSFGAYRRLARKKLGQLWLTWPLQYPLSLLVSSGLDSETYATKIVTPAVVIHGDADQIIPIEEGKSIYDALNSKPKFFWLLRGAGHTQAFQAPDSPFKLKLAKFFCEQHPNPEKCFHRMRSATKNLENK